MTSRGNRGSRTSSYNRISSSSTHSQRSPSYNVLMTNMNNLLFFGIQLRLFCAKSTHSHSLRIGSCTLHQCSCHESGESYSGRWSKSGKSRITRTVPSLHSDGAFAASIPKGISYTPLSSRDAVVSNLFHVFAYFLILPTTVPTSRTL